MISTKSAGDGPRRLFLWLRRGLSRMLCGMDVFAHAMLPVIVATVVDRGVNSPEDRLSGKALWLVAVFGAAPDVLSPHVSLDARLTSYTHTAVALGVAVAIVLFLLALKKVGARLGIWLVFAYGLHLVCDMVAGGIGWNYPFGRSVIGDFYVNPIWWVPIDAVCLLLLYFLNREAVRERVLCWVHER